MSRLRDNLPVIISNHKSIFYVLQKSISDESLYNNIDPIVTEVMTLVLFREWPS